MGATFGELLVYPTYSLGGKEVNENDVVWHSFPSGLRGGGRRRPFMWLTAPGVQKVEDIIGAGALIYFHANAETLGDVAQDMYCLRKGLRMSVLAVEYPGYGLAEPDTTGSMTEGIDEAAIHALRFVVSVQKVPPTQVILHGRSLGSGPALRLALYARDELLWNVGSVVLQSPYTSLAQVGQDYAGSAGLALTPNYYDNLATLRKMCTGSLATSIAREHWIPLLLLHGEHDEMVPSYHSMALHTEAKKQGHPAVRVHFQPGATHNTYRIEDDVIAPVLAFKIQHLRRPKKGTGLARFSMPKVLLEGEGDEDGKNSMVMRCCAQTRVSCQRQCAMPAPPT